MNLIAKFSALLLFIAAPLFGQDQVITMTDKMLQAYVEQDLFSGTVLLAKDKKPICKRAFGFKNLEKKIANKTDTPLKIGSIVKDFTAVVILQLLQDGKLKLDDPIGKHLDDFPREILDKVTIRQLLQHRSGFGDYLMLPQARQKINELKTVDEIISLFKDESLLFEPGTAEEYSNSGYTVLGAVIESITGISYSQAVEKMILAPLEMTNTYFDWQKIVKIQNRPKWYMKSATGRKVISPFDEFPSPSGGAYSTVEDMLKFELSLLYDNKLLPDELKMLRAERYSRDIDTKWTDFISAPGTVTAKAGGAPGTNAVVIDLPADGYIIIVLSNYDEPIAEIIGKNIHSIITKGEYQEPKLSIFRHLYEKYKSGGPEFVKQNFKSILQEYDFQDPPAFVLNRVGYDLLGEDKIDEAIEIFSINTELFPDIPNTFDSLAEAYMTQGNDELAVKYYRKVLEMDPENENAKHMLETIRNSR